MGGGEVRGIIMPETIARISLPPSGEAVLTPPLDAPAQNEYRVILRGTVECMSEVFDARYLQDGVTRHSYLRWSPVEPVLLREDTINHLYEYRIPTETIPQGQSLSLQIDIDRLIDRFLITRSEIVSSLQSNLSLDVVRIPLVAPFPWIPVLTGTGVLAGFGWVLQRRMQFQGLDDDLRQRLADIQRKAHQAKRVAVGHDPVLQKQLNTLAEASLPLARQVAHIRHAYKSIHRGVLETDIETLSHRLQGFPEGTSERARQETEATLTEKRKTLQRYNELTERESLCLLRLDKIAAILESATLTLHSAETRTNEPASEEHLRKAVDAEVSAIHMVAQEIPEIQQIVRR
jgi:hypothetical protein